MQRAVFVLFLVAASLGCGASLTQLRDRAAPDLECPQHRLQIVILDGSQAMVRGCDQEALYQEKCDLNLGITGANCIWVLHAGPRGQR
ncbi:MAG: hypothetical protein ACOX6T_05380 [Myxococcales bacterium]|jgi:hypothetical protein